MKQGQIAIRYFFILILLVQIGCEQSKNVKMDDVLYDLKNIWLREQDEKYIALRDKGKYTFVLNHNALDIMYCKGNTHESRPLILINFSTIDQTQFYYERIRNILPDTVSFRTMKFISDSIISITEVNNDFDITGYYKYTFKNDEILKEKQSVNTTN